MRILKKGAVSDIQHIPAPSLFLSNTMCHLRMKKSGPVNNIGIINKVQVEDMFRNFFDTIWEEKRFTTVQDRASIDDFLYYAIQMIRVQIIA
jgi:hypothetical protein